MTPHAKRSKPNFGNKPPFSIQLPAPTTIAPWWINKGMMPLCESEPSACISEPIRLFEQEQKVAICGKHPRLAPIRVAIIKMHMQSVSPNETQNLQDISPYCLLEAGRLQVEGGFPNHLSQHDYSENLGTCVAQASGLRSWIEGAPDLHYLSVMRFKLHPRGYLQQAAVVFVIDERDWPVLEDLVVASAKSFEVDWSRFEDRITSTFWDQPPERPGVPR